MKRSFFWIAICLSTNFNMFFLNAQSGGNWPPIDQQTQEELDCIARKHLTNGNTSDLILKSANRGFAGYFVKYDKVKSAIRIYGAETTVILRDDSVGNALIRKTFHQF